MILALPDNAPKTTPEAFEYINGIGTDASIDDLKILCLVEAIGEELYAGMARGTDNAKVSELLMANGREEMLHAQRVSSAIEIMTGEPFPIPALADNPIYTPLPEMPVTAEALGKLAEAEYAGNDLYARIAASFDNAEARALFDQNGREEIGHANRLAQAAELLAGQ